MSSPNRLPPFLHPLRESKDSGQRYNSAVFPESDGIRPVHVHWWPCKANDAPKTVFIFVPGNPGVIEFYTPFLDTVYNMDTSGRLAILTFSHVGHAPLLGSHSSLSSLNPSHFSLTSQLQNALRIVDALKSTFGSSVKMVLVGHSVGAWFTLQVLRLRANVISSVFLLFPAIAEIADTPSGQTLSWLFRVPLPRVTANLARFLYYLPIRILGLMFPSYPRASLNALHSFVRSPQAVFAALTMAHDEMINIRLLDVELLDKHRDQLWFYFAEHDSWVGGQKVAILQTMGEGEGHIVHGEPGVPHAFCISEPGHCRRSDYSNRCHRSQQGDSETMSTNGLDM